MEGIKSAFERAWERAEKLEVSEEKLEELELQPEGARIAARYLKEGDYDLGKALEGYPPGKRKHVRAGAEATFVSNIVLPRNGRLLREAGRAIEGLKLLKKDKSRISHIAGRMDSLFAYYERSLRQSHKELKKELEEKVRRSMAQQGMPASQRMDVERTAEFEQRWHEVQTKLEWEYGAELSRLKEEMARAK